MARRALLGIDVGQKRIGIAWTAADPQVAVPLVTIQAGENVVDEIKRLVREKEADAIIVGLPRNQQGEETNQTTTVRQFADKLKEAGLDVIFQDESLTSVIAEESLKEHNKPYAKEDVDKLAAAYILRDYLEEQRD
ncbi:MAG TPA: Holliday junction resolvase RuvX [Candidatus Saccharimonadales bacterium]|nr:Holliday junction resolvase RuvX [Candidatus Saccharimonadales bacterium]